MIAEPQFMRPPTIRNSTDGDDVGFGAAVFCGWLFLIAPTLVAIILILLLLFMGVHPILIEKAMVWLSVPWFAMCYALCKRAHGAKVYFRDGTEN